MSPGAWIMIFVDGRAAFVWGLAGDLSWVSFCFALLLPYKYVSVYEHHWIGLGDSVVATAAWTLMGLSTDKCVCVCVCLWVAGCV